MILFDFFQISSGGQQVLFFFFFWLSQGQVVWPKLSDPFVSQNPSGVCASRTNSRLCSHHLFVWSNLNFLHNFQGVTPLTQSYTLFALNYCIRLLCNWSFHFYRGRWSPHGVMVKAMDCGIVVSEFVLQSRYYVHFRTNNLGKCMNPLILPTMG